MMYNTYLYCILYCICVFGVRFPLAVAATSALCCVKLRSTSIRTTSLVVLVPRPNVSSPSSALLKCCGQDAMCGRGTGLSVLPRRFRPPPANLPRRAAPDRLDALMADGTGRGAFPLVADPERGMRRPPRNGPPPSEHEV
eukprot:scaffold1491_cov110-Isochrysis_galbana.AAC.5